jgi:hypothetical protein
VNLESIAAVVPPLCTVCRIRAAQPHYAVGYYKQCESCRLQRARARQRARAKGQLWWETCFVCGGPLRSSTTSACSTRCSTIYKQQLRARYKADVIGALGGACVCVGAACWHHGPCGVSDPEVLEVDHIHDNGGEIRSARPDGTRAWRGRTVSRWSRYRRALGIADHGMQLLCSNCHRKVTYERQAAIGSA